MNAQIAQSVEQRTENPRVTGSIPVLGISVNNYPMWVWFNGRTSAFQAENVGSIPITRLHLDVWQHLLKCSDINMREWLSWWSATLPRSRPRVRVPSRALVENSGNVDFTAFPLFFCVAYRVA